MAIELLELTDGGASLEFESEDLSTISKAIRELFGEVRVEYHPFCATYRFGGCEFTFQNEWDDPCLIAKSTAGTELLRQLCASMNGGSIRFAKPFDPSTESGGV